MISTEDIATMTRSYYEFLSGDIDQCSREQFEQNQEYVAMLKDLLIELSINSTVDLKTASKEDKDNVISDYLLYIRVSIQPLLYEAARACVADRVRQISGRINNPNFILTAKDLSLVNNPKHRLQVTTDIYNKNKERFIGLFCKETAEDTIKNMVQQPSGPPRNAKRPRLN